MSLFIFSAETNFRVVDWDLMTPTPPEDEGMILDTYVNDLLGKSSDAKAALNVHLDNKPKLLTVSYDNIDGNAKSNDFVIGEERENSYHWCSSVIFEDVVT